MKIAVLTSASIIFSVLANAQKLNKSQIDVDIQKLIELKVEYEKYRVNEQKGDSVFSLYKEQINKIKKSPKIYLKHINCALRNDDAQLKKQSFPYKYLTVAESNISLRRHIIRKIDFYRVIKYSLFKRDAEILPDDFRGLKFIDEKNYNGYSKAKQGDFKIAKRALLSNLSLTCQEIKFIKNDDNQTYIIDMKKYLDVNGIDLENKVFIKWAINYLIKYPGVSLAYLDNAYEPIRNKDYMPKDRDIKQ